MAISLAVLCTTVGAQLAAAWFNSFKNNKSQKEMSRKQKEFEDKVVKEGIANAREEFKKLCNFQREIDAEMQHDRITLIHDNHKNSIFLAAYESSLKSWPLMIPPYVIKNDLLMNQSLQKPIPLNCILTTSTDNKFNKAIFYKIEESIARFCAEYWNISSDKSIHFLQGAWRNNYNDIGSKHKDLYSHLYDVPTLVISPVIKDEKLIFRFYWWGMSPDPNDAHVYDNANEFNPELNVSFTPESYYSEEVMKSVLTECIPKLEAFISFFADTYYWNFYKNALSLPLLISAKKIDLPESDIADYANIYSDQVIKYLDKSKCTDIGHVVDDVKVLDYISPSSEIICKIQQCIINNRDYLQVFQISDLSEISNLDSDLSVEVSNMVKQLSEKEGIKLHVFSNDDEMFFNAKTIYDFSEKSRLINIKFLDKYSFMACVTDDTEKIIYSSTASRFHLFVSAEKIPFSTCKTATLDIDNRSIIASNEENSPFGKLTFGEKTIKETITKTRKFLSEIKAVDLSSFGPTALEIGVLTNAVAKMLYPTHVPVVLNPLYHRTTTFTNDIESWISDNRQMNESELLLILSYDNNDKVYQVHGYFIKDEEVVSEKIYKREFRYLDSSVMKLFKFGYATILNYNKYEKK